MSSLQAYKRRIRSIDSTSNIARAMELVSSVKVKKLRNKYNLSIDYLNSLENTINEVLYLNNLEMNINKEGISLNIVITSNLGLCGQYNEAIINLVSKEDKSNSSYIVFGEKGRNYLKNNGYDILLSYIEYDGFESNDIQEQFSKRLYKLVKEGKVKDVNAIYTKYVNNLKYEVVKEKIYPFDVIKNKPRVNYLIEPNNSEILNGLLSLALKTKVNSILLNSILSENASRNNAMKKAKDNADELKEELVLVYNKIRQQQITNELSDIVNGM